jgi:hypothetical protein
MRITALPAVALIMLAAPASAAGLAMPDPVSISAPDNCSIPRISIQTDSPLLLHPNLGDEATLDAAVVNNPWAPGATSHWNAGVNRAVDHLIAPPANVRVYATQTGDELRGHYEGTSNPNQTFAAFEIVIH